MDSRHAISFKTVVGAICGTLVVGGFVATRPAIRANADGPPNAAAGEGRPNLTLELGLSLSGEGSQAAFVLTNQGQEPFRTTPITTNYNRLVITSPDGKSQERFYWKDGIPPVVVPPAAKQTWRVDLAKMPEFKDAGIYRLRWKVGEVESAEIVVVREG